MADNRTVYCGNLPDNITEELLYELFLQVAPLERVRIPTDKDGRKSNYAFITMKHEVSVNYAVQLLQDTKLYDKRLNIKPRTGNQRQQAPQQQQHNHQQQQQYQRFEGYPPNIFNNMNQQNMMDNVHNLVKMGAMFQQTYNQMRNNYNNRDSHYRNDGHRNGPYNDHRRDNYHDRDRSGRRHRSHNDRSNRNRYH